ncbi:MAG TPA: hypothetical protein VHH72_00120 [Solirubrobacterales bacterium]|nr:hypothetical protein [Solirubrobacterales bacterium]
MTCKRLAAIAAAALAATALAFAGGSSGHASAAQGDALPNATPGPHGSVPPGYPLAR